MITVGLRLCLLRSRSVRLNDYGMMGFRGGETVLNPVPAPVNLNSLADPRAQQAFQRRLQQYYIILFLKKPPPVIP